mgnify:CR=1 FL=1
MKIDIKFDGKPGYGVYINELSNNSGKVLTPLYLHAEQLLKKKFNPLTTNTDEETFISYRPLNHCLPNS